MAINIAETCISCYSLFDGFVGFIRQARLLLLFVVVAVITFCRVFAIICLKVTMSLGYTVLQLLYNYTLRYM